MQQYPGVLKIINDRIIQIRDKKINRTNLDFDSYEKIQALKDFLKGNSNDLEIIQYVKFVIAIIPQANRSAIALVENSSPKSDTLTDIQYASLIGELEYYKLFLEQIVSDFYKSNNLSLQNTEIRIKKKAGRKPSPNSFQVKGLNKVHLAKLYDLELSGLKYPNFINKESSSSKEQFIEFFLSSDFSNLSKEKVCFHFGIETIYVAYIFYWLYEFEFISLPFNAVIKSNICRAITGKKIVDNDLSSPRNTHISLYKFNHTKKILATTILDKESKPHEVIPIINNYLSNIFPLQSA